MGRYGLARQQEKQRKLRQAQADKERAQAKPKLYGDKTRRNNAWQGNVSERLYQEAKLRSKRQSAMAEMHRKEEDAEMRQQQSFLFQSGNGSAGTSASVWCVGGGLTFGLAWLGSACVLRAVATALASWQAHRIDACVRACVRACVCAPLGVPSDQRHPVLMAYC